MFLHGLEQRGLRRGGARLISSASTMFANTGPREAKAAGPGRRVLLGSSVPVMSLGTRSGVNWMRRKSSRIDSATERTISVFASPGTPTSSAWPPARTAMMISSSTSRWPTIRRETSSRSLTAAARNASRSAADAAALGVGSVVFSGPDGDADN